jgi:hypothetical protein
MALLIVKAKRIMKAEKSRIRNHTVIAAQKTQKRKAEDGQRER